MRIAAALLLTFDRIWLVPPRKLVLNNPNHLSKCSILDFNLVNN
ncbi:MAG: hypothetical protein RLZZ207_1637 [Bacteroidota bacterium]|jgi:hypothetical protein